MRAKWDIQQPGESELEETVRVMAAGRARGAIAEARAATLRRYLDAQGADSVRLWRAKGRRGIVAAAAVCENPGRTGMLVHSPADSAGVKVDALSAVCAVAADDAIQRGMSLVQSLELPEDEDDADALTNAGFRQLAELVYMRVATADVSETTRGELAWRSYGRFDEQELARVIAATYENSLDCPAISGLRDIEDVIAGHKAGGIFTPETWWIVDHHGEPAGCVLVNDATSPSVSEVVYLGVVPAHRGAGLGEALVRHACAAARRRGRATLTLAVDAANTPAVRAYERAGFRRTQRRISYIKTAR
ncbi:MAG: GNAT family N-acetyltransferase [Phycisphaerae bacterium]